MNKSIILILLLACLSGINCTCCKKSSLFSCYGVGKCNIFCCNCDNGCLYYSEERSMKNRSDWMSKISDAALIRKISIPGTHDSGALYGGPTGFLASPYVVTQSMSIRNQLNAGIRFLDIRCRHYTDQLPIHHGEVYQKITFRNVLQSVTEFLTAYKSETVLMRIKEEYKSDGNTRSFSDTLRAYLSAFNSFIWTTSNGLANPTLKEVRGKIVILYDFETNYTFGLDFKNSFTIQDEYKANIIDKKNYILNTLNSAKKDSVINFLSAQGRFGQSINDNAIESNFFVFDYCQKNNPKYVGIVPADFPGQELIYQIIKSNSN